MVKRVQRVRHSGGEAAIFLGREGEFTYDIDNNNIRVHDGINPGGDVIPNQTYVDAADTANAAAAAAAQSTADSAAATADAAIPKATFTAADEVIISTGAAAVASLALAAATVVGRAGSGPIVALNEATFKSAFNLTIGTDVQAWDADLDSIAAMGATLNNFIVGDGVNWVKQTAAAARNSMGLGSAAEIDTSDIDLYSFEPGTRLAGFYQATVPTGWTQVAVNDATLIVTSGAGGGQAGSWTISGLSSPAHAHNQQGTFATGASTENIQTDQVVGTNVASFNHGHFVTISGVTTDNTVTISSDASWRPFHLLIVVGQKI